MAPKPAEKAKKAKELKRKDPEDAPDEATKPKIRKRSRVEKPNGTGDGKRQETDKRREEMEKRLRDETNEAVRQAVQTAKTAAAGAIGEVLISLIDMTNAAVEGLAKAAVQQRHAGGDGQIPRHTTHRVFPNPDGPVAENGYKPRPVLKPKNNPSKVDNDDSDDGDDDYDDTNCRPKDHNQKQGKNKAGCGRVFTAQNTRVNC